MAWSKCFVERRNVLMGDAYLSVVFTWDLPEAYQRAVWLKMEGYDVYAGGPAVRLMPDYLADVAKCNGREIPALHWHNPEATRTSRGCVRRCAFCAVPKIEGDIRELKDWPVGRIVCDDNLLACSRAHFDRVVDRLKPVKRIDIQGVDARLMTKYHAERLAELDCLVHVGFDHVSMEPAFRRAHDLLRAAGLPARAIRGYVLIGYNDTPEDALYRLRTVRSLGSHPNPMRYNPLDALQRDSYVGPNWTDRELRRYMRYFANLRYFAGIPFEEFEG